MTELTLEAVDRDEALTSAIAELCGTTRAGFLRTTALGGAAMLAALAAPASAAEVSDVEILRFGLRFERLQATFYTQAEELGTIGTMTSAKQEWARTLGAHERAHVKILKEVLGPKAEGAPTFDFGERERERRRRSPARRWPWRTSRWRCSAASRRRSRTAA